MDPFVLQIIFELLQYRRGSIAETGRFGSLTHNADLCPGYQRKIEQILDSYQKYHQITYDIQGVRDRGSDVIIRQERDNDIGLICFQIKSDTDLDAPDYLTKIKAQAFETRTAYHGLADYYLVLCCNLAKDNKSFQRRQNQIRSISAEFALAKDIHVIEPQFAIAFLQLSSIQIDAAIKRRFGSEDIVFRLAADCVFDLTPTEKALLFRVATMFVFERESAVSLTTVRESNHLLGIYEAVPDRCREWFEYQSDPESFGPSWFSADDFEDLEVILNRDIDARIAVDLEALEGQFIIANENNGFNIITSAIEPVIAMLVDGHLRYGYDVDELIDYLMNLFGPNPGYTPELAENIPSLKHPA